MAKIVSITYLGEEDTYNMEVEEHRNFSVNGGLIVHNSYDSASMGLVAYHAKYSKHKVSEKDTPIKAHKKQLAMQSRRFRRLLS